MLSTKEVAEKLEVGTSTIKRWVKNGKLKNYSKNSHHRFLVEEIELFAIENKDYLDKIKLSNTPIKIGEKFHRLTVTEIISPSLNRCKCDCGKIDKLVSTTRLRNNVIKRCSPQCALDTGKSMANTLYRQYERQGRRKNRKFFFLTREETFTLFQSNCHYCDSPPSRTRKIKQALNGQEYTYNGIDRLDSSKDYTLDNVVPCCSKCNWMKHVLSVDDFKTHITKIYKNFCKTA